ncbi:MAG: septal ring lytic transglycosylase RlpA family protein [Candidatus Paceibacterota bacterium]
MKKLIVVVALLVFFSSNAIGSVGVTVRSGATLWSIAQDFNMSVSELMGINDLEDATIYPGQELKVKPYVNSYAVVSWYGSKFHGRSMANGEEFDMHDPKIVAHKWLPFGTKVKLTRVDTNHSIKVIVKDRGPYVEGRNFDLSRAAAEKLNMKSKGVIECKVEIIS